MANEIPPGSQGPRRRPPPVIDLEAKEVPTEAPAAASPDLPPEAAAPGSSDPPQQPEAAAPPPPEPPAPEPEPQPAAEPKPSFAFVPEKPKSSSGHAAAALVGGVAGGVLAALAFWLLGSLAGGPSTAPDLNPRLAAIEKQLDDLAARPADDTAARVSKLEAAAATPRPPATDPVVLGRLTANETAVKSMSDNMAALSRRADAADAAIKDTNASIGKLSATVTDVQRTARQAAAGSDRDSRLAIAASALRGAVERGDPFTGELAVVKPLAADASAVAQLEPFAGTGVPSTAALGQELAALVRPMLRASDGTPATPTSSGFLEKLQANAERLVRVRPIGEETRGDDRSAILSRIEQCASQGNTAGALAEIAKLPAEARAPLDPWIAKAEARNKAIEASRKLSADAVAALKAAP